MAKEREEFIQVNMPFQVLSIALNVAEEKNEQSGVKELEEFLDNQELEIESYDEELVRKLVDKIVVYDEMLKVIFKSGIEILIDK
ncbi:hypothetical protein ACYSNN_04325 [Peptoniphilus genitalis]